MKTRSMSKFPNQVEEDPKQIQQRVQSSNRKKHDLFDNPSRKIFTNQVNREGKPNIKSTIKKEIKDKKKKLDQLEQQVKQQQRENLEDQKNLQKIDNNKDIQLNNNNNELFNYKLINGRSIKQNEICRAIAFNKDNSIVVAGCNSKIKVFEFKQEQLKQTQLINEHQQYIATLNFMKKSNNFISGSDDSQIIIWSMSQNCQWICSQKLIGHTKWIKCLIMNINEDLIITGSYDKTIKFWVKQNQWLCSNTVTDHAYQVVGLSLNDSYNFQWRRQSQQDEKWNVIQKITIEQWGIRLCFINDNLFTFQPYRKDCMHIYEMSSTNQLYSKTKEITLQNCQNGDCFFFPQQFIIQKFFMVNKNRNVVNLIKNQNGFFITQTITFENCRVWGQMSEDGEYLLTWDEKSNEYQIRKYHEDG